MLQFKVLLWATCAHEPKLHYGGSQLVDTLQLYAACIKLSRTVDSNKIPKIYIPLGMASEDPVHANQGMLDCTSIENSAVRGNHGQRLPKASQPTE